MKDENALKDAILILILSLSAKCLLFGAVGLRCGGFFEKLPARGSIVNN